MLANPFLRIIEKFYGFFVTVGSNLQTILLLYMRLTWGHQLFLIGLSKLKDIGAVVQFFTKLGIVAPTFHAYLVGIFETVGGIALILGFASRIFTIPIIVIMLTALSLAHAEALANFQFVFNPKILVVQEPYPFLFTALMVFIFGPGRISLDAWLKRWISHQPRY
jgi:putative oxidoreductase